MEGGTGECPTSTLQMTPERMCREIHLPVGACSTQSSPFRRCPQNPMRIQSIIDGTKFKRPRSHKVSAEPMPSVQVNLFSWVERSFRYTRHEVLVVNISALVKSRDHRFYQSGRDQQANRPRYERCVDLQVHPRTEGRIFVQALGEASPRGIEEGKEGGWESALAGFYRTDKETRKYGEDHNPPGSRC